GNRSETPANGNYPTRILKDSGNATNKLIRGHFDIFPTARLRGLLRRRCRALAVVLDGCLAWSPCTRASRRDNVSSAPALVGRAAAASGGLGRAAVAGEAKGTGA